MKTSADCLASWIPASGGMSGDERIGRREATAIRLAWPMNCCALVFHERVNAKARHASRTA